MMWFFLSLSKFYSDVCVLCSFWIDRGFSWLCSLIFFSITFGNFWRIFKFWRIFGFSTTVSLLYFWILIYTYFRPPPSVAYVSYFCLYILYLFPLRASFWIFSWPIFLFPKYSPVFCLICFKPNYWLHYFKSVVFQIQNSYLVHFYRLYSLLIFSILSFISLNLFSISSVKACVW